MVGDLGCTFIILTTTSFDSKQRSEIWVAEITTTSFDSEQWSEIWVVTFIILTTTFFDSRRKEGRIGAVQNCEETMILFMSRKRGRELEHISDEIVILFKEIFLGIERGNSFNNQTGLKFMFTT